MTTTLEVPPQTLTAENSPNLARYVHQHAQEIPHETILLVPEQSPRPTALQTPGKGWLPCTWSNLSDFIAELVLAFESEPSIGSAQSAAAPAAATHGTARPMAALIISPAEDMLPITLALISLGYGILPINPHLSSRSIAHLLHLANASLLVCSAIPDFQDQTLLPSLRTFKLTDQHRLGEQLRRKRTFAPPPDQAAQFAAAKEASFHQVVQEPAYYLHSSGSTGLPKLVHWRNSANYAQIVAVTQHIKSEVAPDDQRVLFLTKDLFAVIPMGLSLRALYGGKGWTVAFPRESVLHQTTEGLLEDMIAVQATNISVYTCDAAAFVRYVAAPPADAAHKAKQARYLHFLRSLGDIPCGGSRIDRSLIREAIPLGIQIKSTFGTTESSAALTSFPDTLGSNWGTIKPEDVTEDMIDQVLGIVPLPLVGCRFEPLMWNTQDLQTCERDGQTNGSQNHQFYQLFLDSNSKYFSSPQPDNDGWWSSRDLFKVVHHPQTQQPIYVYETRMDDMVILGNGASLHPARIEESIYNALSTLCGIDEKTVEHDTAGNAAGLNRAVEIMLVGTGRTYPSLLIEGMPSEKQQAAFLSAFQKNAAHINASLAAYSHFNPRLFYFLKADEHLPRTVKNTVNRKKAEQEFAPQLDLRFALLP